MSNNSKAMEAFVSLYCARFDRPLTEPFVDHLERFVILLTNDFTTRRFISPSVMDDLAEHP
jgi:hypothetical protein